MILEGRGLSEYMCTDDALCSDESSECDEALCESDECDEALCGDESDECDEALCGDESDECDEALCGDEIDECDEALCGDESCTDEALCGDGLYMSPPPTPPTLTLLSPSQMQPPPASSPPASPSPALPGEVLVTTISASFTIDATLETFEQAIHMHT